MSDQPSGAAAKATVPMPVGTRRSGRARRPPRNPNSPAASLADKAAVSDEATKKKQQREKETRAKEKKKKTKDDLPRATDPSALVRASQRPRGAIYVYVLLIFRPPYGTVCIPQCRFGLMASRKQRRVGYRQQISRD